MRKVTLVLLTLATLTVAGCGAVIKPDPEFVWGPKQLFDRLGRQAP